MLKKKHEDLLSQFRHVDKELKDMKSRVASFVGIIDTEVNGDQR